MIRHIEFCLEEIECEIDAQGNSGLPETGRLGLQRHIAEMRAVLADWEASTHDASPTGARTVPKLDGPIGDKLVWIRGIDPDTANLLAARGVTSFQTIADWRHADIRALGDDTLSLDRIAEQNWIEQAAILVTGQLTLHAKQIELARIATIEAVAARIPDGTVPIEATPVMAAPIAINAPPLADTITIDPDQSVIEIAADPQPAATEVKIVALESPKRASIGRRIAQVAAALAIIAAGIGALSGWDLAKISAITAALAEQAQGR